MQKIILPNFLIVGMAKCGTSSLSQYLQQHPDIFISEKKEPRFITSQVMQFPLGGPLDFEVENWYVKNYDEYLALFENASAKAIGEASADTIYFHRETVPVIKQYLGDPKIIILLRNPVARSYSAYQHLLRDNREHLSFEAGLKAESMRIQQNFELIYHYKSASFYYERVKLFMESFKHVKVILSEDLQKSPSAILTQLFDFLEVDASFHPDLTLNHNISGQPKSPLLHRTLQRDTKIRKLVRPLARVFIPDKQQRVKLVNWMSSKNLSRSSINPATKQLLIEYFRKDIEQTSALLGKDLSHWLK